MGLPGSHSALGRVALGPPDKMGSAVDVLAKARQKGRVRGLEARAGEIEPLRSGGRKRSASGVGNGFTRTQRRLRGSQPWNSPPHTPTHTHAVLNWDKRVLGLKAPSPLSWFPKVGKRETWWSQPRRRLCRRGGGGEVVQGSV